MNEIDTLPEKTENNHNDDSKKNLINSIENRLNSYKTNPAHLDFNKQQKLIIDMKEAGYSADKIQSCEKELNYIRKELSHKAIFVQRYTQKINSGTLRSDEVQDWLFPMMREYMTILKYHPKKIDKVIQALSSRHVSERMQQKATDKFAVTDINYPSTNFTLKCPKCSSTNISTEKKGFSLGKATVGGLVFGAVGLLGGLIGKNTPINWCSSCGNRW
ncbi:hypothetical protein ASG89_05690 [Paenibacillus sp. Soil766]|uniref:hypothetical protein n=1 Tax=Paenibacillus sp. Soil766 TaxID=1736404 RepID=UPI00070983FB|nr:hypothetical protein [Paenibacillus sp. Soil766]KRE98492.1 hypothetical protein ASG89_05690 [Paenibacillus sp. Soil766]